MELSPSPLWQCSSGHCSLSWSQRGTCIQIRPRHVGVGKLLTGSDVPWRLQWTACFLVAGKCLWADTVLTHQHPGPAGSIWGKWKAGKVSGIEPLGTSMGTFAWSVIWDSWIFYAFRQMITWCSFHNLASEGMDHKPMSQFLRPAIIDLMCFKSRTAAWSEVVRHITSIVEVAIIDPWKGPLFSSSPLQFLTHTIAKEWRISVLACISPVTPHGRQTQIQIPYHC